MDNETLGIFKDTVHRLVRETLVPLENQLEETDEVPEEIIQLFKDMGLFGLSIPEAYGGLGLSVAEEVEVVQELTWASAAFRSVFGINLGVSSMGLVKDGTEEQKREWLPKLAAGATASFCLTEPDVGSDASAVQTRGIRDGDDYVISGYKRYITNAPRADLFTVMARTSKENLPKNAHISAFLVPADTPGITIAKKDRKMGQAGSLSADVIFDEVRVPAKNIIGGVEGRGFATAMKALDRGRLHLSAVCIGQARRILHESLKFATERKQFGQPIAEFQLIQAMLADSQAELYAAESMVRDAARLYDEGQQISQQASCCKMFASEMVGRIADRGVQIHGGAGYMRETPVERLYRDVRLFRIYEGTTQIQQLIIARNLIKQHETRNS